MPEIDSETRPTLARGTRLATDKATGQPVLLFPEGVVHLSSTAEAILKRCDGKRTTGAIVTSLAEEYEAEEQDLRADVVDCLGQLIRRKLVILA